MIAAVHRFHGHASLRFVYQQGRTRREGPLGLKYVLNPRRHSYRAAVVISRKISKSAVVRNRSRRRLYEQLRLQIPDTSLAYDLVLSVFTPEVTTMNAEDMALAVHRLLMKGPYADAVTTDRPDHGIVNAKERTS